VVHDSNVRRIATITPDILGPKRKHEICTQHFPTTCESKDNIAKRTPGVRVQTVNGVLAGEKTASSRMVMRQQLAKKRDRESFGGGRIF
jgi:hypothetical protein